MENNIKSNYEDKIEYLELIQEQFVKNCNYSNVEMIDKFNLLKVFVGNLNLTSLKSFELNDIIELFNNDKKALKYIMNLCFELLKSNKEKTEHMTLFIKSEDERQELINSNGKYQDCDDTGEID